MKAHMYFMDGNENWIPARGDALGYTGSGGGGVAGVPRTPWSYAAPSGGITDTADDVFQAAPGDGKSVYLERIDVMNSSATATEVVIKDGSTVIWRSKFGASMIQPVHIHFDPPLFASNNAALNHACITNATVTYVNASGFIDKSALNLAADITGEDELYDDSGNVIVDDAGAAIYVVN